MFVYFRGNCGHYFSSRFFLSIFEVMFSYICFDSARFCWKTVSMWNSATQQKVNLLSVTISSVINNLLHVHHCCILLLYWSETVLQYKQVFIMAKLLEQVRKWRVCLLDPHHKTGELENRRDGVACVPPALEVNWLKPALLGIHHTLRSNGRASWKTAFFLLN